MSTKIDIFHNNGADLPATLADERSINFWSERQYLSLILANIAALFGVARLPAVIPAAATLTRPADTTPYASGDLVANSVTNTAVVPLALPAARVNAGLVQVRRVRLQKSAVSVTNAAFYVHLFTITPTVTNGDNGAIVPLTSGYVGTLSVASMIAGTAGAVGIGAPLVGTEIICKAGAGTQNLFALIEARGAYTPASAEIFTLTAEVLQG